MSEIPKERPVYLFCEVGLRGYIASNILKGHGYKDVRNLIGGLKTYETATKPIITPTPCLKANKNDCNRPLSHDESTAIIKVDACGIQCPGPILKLKKSIESLQPGQLIEVRSTDAGFPHDAASWCSSTGNKFIERRTEKGIHYVLIEKSTSKNVENVINTNEEKGKTFILFSDDLDKALATFVLANGAAATGKKATIFFTFWGLNTIKKSHKPNVKKDLFFRSLAVINRRTRVPVNSLRFQCGWVCLLILWGNYSQLLDYVIYASLIFYAITIFGIFKMRRMYFKIISIVVGVRSRIFAIITIITSCPVGCRFLNRQSVRYIVIRCLKSMELVLRSATRWSSNNNIS